MNKSFLILLIVIVAALAPRLFMLGAIPSSMSDDEIRLVYSAYSIWETGKGLNGDFLPLSFPIDGYSFNPVPIYIVSFFVGLFDLNMFWGRLPFALAGTATVISTFLIALKLTKNTKIATLTSLVLAFSAWHLQLSRFAYEGTIALMFYTFGILLFLKIKKNNIFLTVLSFFLFLLAFYSYSGTKLIFLPIAIALIWYKLKELNLKQIFVCFLFILLTFFSFFYLTKFENASDYGSKQFFFQNTRNVVAEKVELERRNSDAPELIKKIFHNKFTYLSNIFIHQYSYAFSPQYLFTSQEGNGIFSIWGRGQFHLVEALLILPGIIFLFIKKKKELILLLSFIIIAPLPSGLGADPVTYTIRSSFMLPWFAILIGAGIYSFFYFFSKAYLRNIFYLTLLILYTISIIGYFNQYYFEWDRAGSKHYAKSTQDLAKFLIEEKEKRKFVLVAPSFYNTLLHYSFYSKSSPKFAQNKYGQKETEIENIRFKKGCPDISKRDPRLELPQNSTYVISFFCSGTKIAHNKYRWNPDQIIKYNILEEEWYVYRK